MGHRFSSWNIIWGAMWLQVIPILLAFLAPCQPSTTDVSKNNAPHIMSWYIDLVCNFRWNSMKVKLYIFAQNIKKSIGWKKAAFTFRAYSHSVKHMTYLKHWWFIAGDTTLWKWKFINVRQTKKIRLFCLAEDIFMCTIAQFQAIKFSDYLIHLPTILIVTHCILNWVIFWHP
jgi:hypothetical protein